jgi:transposase InsO family protein
MTQPELIAKNRRSLLVYAERNGVATACRDFKVSKTAFYKIKKQLLETGSLEPVIRRSPRMPNEIGLNKKKLILRLVHDQPMRGPAWYAFELRKQGISIGGHAVWNCLCRFGLNRRYKRLVHIEQLKLKDQPLTERSLRVLKRQFDQIERGQWPGHIVALDTFLVGNMKGVGRVYQVTGLDLCSRYGWAKLYTTKDQAATMDFLERCLIPKFFYNGVDIESVLSDNGTEFIGGKFRSLLMDYEIEHRRIRPGKPMLNGYCERFQRTILEEFYQKVFRIRIFTSVEELNKELDQYLIYYNFERAHFGLHPDGAIPADAFTSKERFLRLRFQKIVHLTRE